MSRLGPTPRDTEQSTIRLVDSLRSPAQVAKLRIASRTRAAGDPRVRALLPGRRAEASGDHESLQEVAQADEQLRLQAQPQTVCRVFYRHLKRLYLTKEQSGDERTADYHLRTEDERETGLRVLRSDFYLKQLSSVLLQK